MVDTAQLVAEVKTKGVTKATAELDKFGKEAREADKDTSSFSKGATKAFNAVKVGAVALTGATAALSALAIKVAASEKEWRTLSSVAGDSVDNFKAAAFAADSVGISAEKLADISKDTREKLGEFIATGGGGFKDFFEQVAPQIGITAEALQHLSGTQVLQKVTNAMNAANIPMEQQSFYLESIASDTTNLIPLLANEGAELNRLTSKYKELNDVLALSTGESGGLKSLSESFDLLSGTTENAASKIAATLAPTLDSFFSSVTENVPTATQALIDFFNVFISTENLSSIKAAEDRLASINEELEKFEGRDLSGGGRGGAGRRSQFNRLKEEAAAAEEQIKSLIEEQKKLDDAEKLSFGGIAAGATGTTFKDDEEAKRAEELYDYRIELARKFNEEQDLLNLEYINGLDARRDAEIANQQMILGASASLFGSLAELQQTFGKDQGKTYKALFAVSKAFAIAESIISIQQGIAKSASLGFPANIPAIASTVAATSGLISNISSTNFDAGNFATGGIVGGGSFAGDNITANVNSGEMILNRGQQKNLFDMANGGGGGSNVTVINNAPNSVARAETLSSGDVKIIVEEVLNSEVLQPNSQYSKNMNNRYKLQRQI